MQQQILDILQRVIHPESGENIVAAGFVAGIADDAGTITVTLRFRKPRDPFAASIRRQCEQLLAQELPSAEVKVEIEQPQKPQQTEKKSFADKIGKVIAVASGKGGVGKSTVTANLAAALARSGYRIGILDADIYGPSQPTMFGCEDAAPEARSIDGTDAIIPVTVAGGIKLMSLGFFVGRDDAMLWRGPMATSALRQLVHQTLWGELDFLLIDLPPGTGDVHLSIISELRIDGAVIVSTPQQVAVADVIRGVAMFRNPSVNIPLLGIIENMAWFTPAELPQNRYYIFGREGAVKFAAENGIEVLGHIPVIESVAQSSDNGCPVAAGDSPTAEYYLTAARRVVEKCSQNP